IYKLIFNEDDIDSKEVQEEVDLIDLRQQRLIKQASKDIPENRFRCVVDVKGDGFCGFRALAVQVFGDENRFLDVKFAMRDQLIQNLDIYLQIFGSEHWFLSPECSRVAACTFGLSTAVYSAFDACIFLPVLPRFNESAYKTGNKPLPLVLHHVNSKHWVTPSMKRPIKLVWPNINHLHSQAMHKLSKDDRVQSFWSLHLSFKKK
ncbi:hypothetical protein CU098_005550, partial [Rhizopus stolonifer]